MPRRCHPLLTIEGGFSAAGLVLRRGRRLWFEDAEQAEPVLIAVIRRLGPQDAQAYRDIRLEGLRDDPAAFGASWEDELARPLDWFARRLESSAVFAAVLRDATIGGVAGLVVPDGVKVRHKGVLWGLFVRPSARCGGLASALVATVVEHARGRVDEVKLSVGAANAAAIQLYIRAGFVQYGIEPRALRIGHVDHDELFFALSVSRKH